MENFFERNKGKELVRRRIENEIEQIVDGLGKGIDVGVKEAVIAFKMNGFETKGSCEGHIDWGHPFPWVDIPFKSNDRLNELAKKYTEKRITPIELEEARNLQVNVERENRILLQKLLDEFYQDSDERILLVKKYASWDRIEPKGADEFKIIGSRELSETEKMNRTEFLNKSRKEFERFVKFLNAKSL